MTLQTDVWMDGQMDGVVSQYPRFFFIKCGDNDPCHFQVNLAKSTVTV